MDTSWNLLMVLRKGDLHPLMYAGYDAPASPHHVDISSFPSQHRIPMQSLPRLPPISKLLVHTGQVQREGSGGGGGACGPDPAAAAAAAES